jgi:hypothetical protein
MSVSASTFSVALVDVREEEARAERQIARSGGRGRGRADGEVGRHQRRYRLDEVLHALGAQRRQEDEALDEQEGIEVEASGHVVAAVVAQRIGVVVLVVSAGEQRPGRRVLARLLSAEGAVDAVHVYREERQTGSLVDSLRPEVLPPPKQDRSRGSR